MSASRVRICVFAQVPPPLVGASYAVQLLLESRFSQVFDIHHIDASYASSVADLGRPRLAKLLRLPGYLARLLVAVWRGYDHVLLTPAFSRLPFIKDAIGILAVKWFTRATLVLWSNSNDLTLLYERSGSMMRRFIRYVLGKADHVVTVGDSLHTHFRPFLPQDRISTIPNGIAEEANDSQRMKPRRDSGTVRIIFLSNMLRTKGWELLLEAATAVCGREPSVAVDFFGAPAADSPLERIAAAFAATPFPDRIRYHGVVHGDRKRDALAAADIFCLPTMYPTEALPLAILEAFRDRLPVVTTPVGAIPDAVVDTKGGFLLPPGDRDALERALLTLCRDAALRERMGEFNRQRYEDHYTMERVASRWIDLFQRLGSTTTRAAV